MAEISTVLADQAANLLVSAAVNGADIFCTILAEVLLLLVNHHFGMSSFIHACMLYWKRKRCPLLLLFLLSTKPSMTLGGG
jgi:hypothetical protein